jgi:small-conductance mechanosensitive channel
MTAELSTFWQNIAAEIGRPDTIWQLAAIAVALLLAKLTEGVVRDRVVAGTNPSQGRAWRLGQGSLKRVVFPLVALALVFTARQGLQPFMHTHLLKLAVPLLGSLAIIRLVAYILRRSFSNASWLGVFERFFSALAWSIVALHIVGWLPSVIDFLNTIALPFGINEVTLWQMLQAAVTVAATVLVALWLSNAFEMRLTRAAEMDASLRIVLGRISRALFTLIAILVALPLVGINLTTLSVFGGALGVGIGFGLQKIASNYVSGFIILLDRSIRLGNLITIGTERGVVTKITARYTVLRNMTGIEFLVPNEQLISSVVQNDAYTDHNVWLSMPVQVSYDSDLELALQLMAEAAKTQLRVLKTPVPDAYIERFADSGIDLLLGFWIADPENGSLGLRSAINMAIWKRFKQHNISIPFPQREIRLLGNSPNEKND